jgi:hypothetical protein
VNSDDSHTEELPAELIAALRSLAGERAPAELAARVELVRSERLTAPPELWERVSADLRLGSHRTRVLSWPRRLTVAAGVLMLGGITWFYWPSTPPLGENPQLPGEAIALAPALSPERQRALRARLLVVEVAPERLSPTARAFSEYFGGPAAALPAASQGEEG